MHLHLALLVMLQPISIVNLKEQIGCVLTPLKSTVNDLGSIWPRWSFYRSELFEQLNVNLFSKFPQKSSAAATKKKLEFLLLGSRSSFLLLCRAKALDIFVC